jgi:hypothetical protein
MTVRRFVSGQAGVIIRQTISSALSGRSGNMLKIATMGPNQTELQIGDDVTVFFSYNTPVAAFVSGKGYIRSEAKYSMTTSKHVNSWLRKNAALNRVVTVPQYQIDALVSVAKVV